MIRKMPLVFTITALLTALSCVVVHHALAQDLQEEFNIAKRKLIHTGKSKYFILEPGFQVVLKSRKVKMTTTVLNETKEINGIVTRVVEEKEEENGKLTEITRNFFAIDQETGDVFYFGEEVDFYKQGKIVDHGGSWEAYKNSSKPGMLMPGNPKVGMRYYQEFAPGVAMDWAEVLSISETVKTPHGELKNCLKTLDSSTIKVMKEYKTFAPGIGLVEFEGMKLISYGYIKEKKSSK